jgi:putative redox protein
LKNQRQSASYGSGNKLKRYNRQEWTRADSTGVFMECKVSWMGQDGMAFAAETGSGHLVTMDGAPEGGGRNLSPRPMEMVLLGTGGCTAYDVVMILKKSRQEVVGCSVTLKAERASEDPKVFTKVHFQFTVTGKNLNPTTVERAITLSHDKYCSASIMIAKTAELTHSFDIVSS